MCSEKNNFGERKENFNERLGQKDFFEMNLKYFIIF